MREAALADIRRALAGNERLHRELERRAARESGTGLLPRSVLYRECEDALRAAFPLRIAELLAVVRPMVWPHGVAGNGFHLDGLAAVGEVAVEADVHASLTVLHGRLAGMIYLLPVSRLPTDIGRRADLVIADHTVSRRQALFSRDAEGRLTVEDLHSTAGTWIGERITRGPTPLEDGDLVRMNGIRVRFHAALPEPG